MKLSFVWPSGVAFVSARSRPLARLALAGALCSALSVGLSACAPKPLTAVGSSTSFTSVSFYPRETGLAWAYQGEGEAPGAVPYVVQAMGPTVFQGQPVEATQMTGRGASQTWFRQISADGVRLLGMHKPGVTIVLDPPWQELPATGLWQVGYSWEGSSKIRILGEDGKTYAQGTLKYRYDVQDQRKVKTPAGEYNVYVVTRQISDDVGGLFPAAQQLWFTPFVGEVRTPEGLLLTGRNFTSKGTP